VLHECHTKTALPELKLLRGMQLSLKSSRAAVAADKIFKLGVGLNVTYSSDLIIVFCSAKTPFVM
jgi:hypothetical protein